MISDPQGTVLVLFAIFCRIGSCIMTLPGFSSARISVTVRFFLDRIVPEAAGLKAGAVAGAELLYALPAAALVG